MRCELSLLRETQDRKALEVKGPDQDCCGPPLRRLSRPRCEHGSALRAPRVGPSFKPEPWCPDPCGSRTHLSAYLNAGPPTGK
ncbi:hypothetical protein EYF80_027450 [Liparis tanakae]|uniref:Uncharacterized protein n=1 Tax=Liparis tanakae TaxID=230148 RepID=A0A4Z2HBF2_9TELE|nr:hypothetical protein EYF80_027450 [Liparis tanakae]